MADKGPLFLNVWKDWKLEGAERERGDSISGRTAGVAAGVAIPTIFKEGVWDKLDSARARCVGAVLGRSIEMRIGAGERVMDGAVEVAGEDVNSRSSALMRPLNRFASAHLPRFTARQFTLTYMTHPSYPP